MEIKITELRDYSQVRVGDLILTTRYIDDFYSQMAIGDVARRATGVDYNSTNIDECESTIMGTKTIVLFRQSPDGKLEILAGEEAIRKLKLQPTETVPNSKKNPSRADAMDDYLPKSHDDVLTEIKNQTRPRPELSNRVVGDDFGKSVPYGGR